MHERVAKAMEPRRGRLLLSPFALGELDYLLRNRLGPQAQARLLQRVAERMLELVSFDAQETALAARIVERFSDLRISLADASVVVLAHKHGVRDLLTLDQRDFRVLPGPGGEPFRILPADA